ncbi:hypothetical protein BC830DRAFT_1135590 [Chytriomyces sp. MP71]|nr:hypothetical protein BC830DRAFT_1135590 [Chytriomyces sp. MP71]
MGELIYTPPLLQSFSLLFTSFDSSIKSRHRLGVHSSLLTEMSQKTPSYCSSETRLSRLASCRVRTTNPTLCVSKKELAHMTRPAPKTFSCGNKSSLLDISTKCLSDVNAASSASSLHENGNLSNPPTIETESYSRITLASSTVHSFPSYNCSKEQDLTDMRLAM